MGMCVEIVTELRERTWRIYSGCNSARALRARAINIFIVCFRNVFVLVSVKNGGNTSRQVIAAALRYDRVEKGGCVTFRPVIHLPNYMPAINVLTAHVHLFILCEFYCEPICNIVNEIKLEKSRLN